MQLAYSICALSFEHFMLVSFVVFFIKTVTFKLIGSLFKRVQNAVWLKVYFFSKKLFVACYIIYSIKISDVLTCNIAQSNVNLMLHMSAFYISVILYNSGAWYIGAPRKHFSITNEC